MERLTYSPHVVDLFAYCGNSIVTEFAPYDLESALRQPIHHGGNVDDVATSSLRSTSRQQLDLAFQAATAMEALHRNDIIHADVTTQQFLVVPSSNGTTTRPILKLNDFNRCRFVPRRIGTDDPSDGGMGERCMIEIPSAPGLYRSPEEYALQPLTTKLDIFSFGHVLYEIWTGTKIWNGVGAMRMREAVQNGELPAMAHHHPSGGTEANDQTVGRLVPECYELDPKHRPTAQWLVNQLRTAMEHQLS
jgi:serine/threonine protein kinase